MYFHLPQTIHIISYDSTPTLLHILDSYVALVVYWGLNRETNSLKISPIHYLFKGDLRCQITNTSPAVRAMVSSRPQAITQTNDDRT